MKNHNFAVWSDHALVEFILHCDTWSDVCSGWLDSDLDQNECTVINKWNDDLINEIKQCIEHPVGDLNTTFDMIGF